jgi:hypothetical protein
VPKIFNAGTCGCNGQFFVNDDCTESFYCSIWAGDEGDGCHLDCEESEVVDLDVTTGTWGCKTRPTDYVCPGKLSMDCPRGSDVLEPECGCAREFWMNQDCTEGFTCSAPKDPESDVSVGTPLGCDSGKRISINWADPIQSECVDESAAPACPGAMHFGCFENPGTDVPCAESGNSLGQCDGCNGQLFINDDCSAGFWCTDSIQDPFLYDGCLAKCHEGKILLPDFAKNSWSCVDSTGRHKILIIGAHFLFYFCFLTEAPTCPGEYNLRCESDDVGSHFDSSICDCEGQLWVSSDCKEAFLCRHSLPDGGLSAKCDGEGLIVNLSDIGGNEVFSCTQDEGQCPGLGGLSLGCSDGDGDEGGDGADGGDGGSGAASVVPTLVGVGAAVVLIFMMM